MRILTSAMGLDLSGVPTFTQTMYNEMTKRGIDVTVYSPLGGPLEKHMKNVKNLEGLDAPDIILAQNNQCAEPMHKAFPNTPLVFYSHHISTEMEQPPNFEADWYLAINEGVVENLINKGVPETKISILRDFVDTEKFVSTKPIGDKLERVLFISNFKKWRNFRRIDAACQKLALKLTCCGSPYGRNYKIEEAINDADLVISWGRGILEAMSCERSVLSFDKLMGDGYLTPEVYYKSRQDNFCGFLSKRTFDSDEDLIQEMQKYDPNSGKKNRELIMKYHNARTGVDDILEILNKFL